MPDGAMYWYGNECSTLSGGWSNDGYTFSNAGNPYPTLPSLTKETNDIYGIQTAGNPPKVLCTQNKTSATATKLKARIKSGTAYSGFNCGIHISTTKSKDMDELPPIACYSSDTTEYKECNLTEAVYLIIILGSTYANRSITCYAVWLE